jgi:periplasmic protein TonB
MYADRTHLSDGSRPASLGASLLICGGVVVALALATPGFVKIVKHDETTVVSSIPIPPDPRPIEIKQKPEAQTPRADPVVAPEQVVKTVTNDNPTITQTTIPDNPPIPFTGTPEGTGATPITPDPPLPMPPLVGASYDQRYAGVLQPPYPAPELRLSREGDVVLRIRIGIDGRVAQVERVSATSDAFYEAARKQALGKWRFKPATRGGVPQESWKTMKLHFQLTQ